jgi:hypothetical protein
VFTRCCREAAVSLESLSRVSPAASNALKEIDGHP